MRLSVKILIVIVILLPILVLVGRYYFSAYPRPSKVGNGVMAPCPNSPNCVSTQSGDESQKIEPIPIRGDAAATLDSIEEVIATMANSKVISRTDSYLYVEFRSSLWNFVDDLEFFVNAEDGVIDARSAARIGYGDGGVNRARYQKIARAFNTQ